LHILSVYDHGHLYLVMRYIEAGTPVSVHSKLGAGTTFTFRLPVAQ
jgi:signal transduction histidine kinase